MSFYFGLIDFRNAGFDPAMFRVDPYGNVLYLHADSASPLAWDIDHWFPCSSTRFYPLFFFLHLLENCIVYDLYCAEKYRGRIDCSKQSKDTSVASVQEETQPTGIFSPLVGFTIGHFYKPIHIHFCCFKLWFQVIQ